MAFQVYGMSGEPLGVIEHELSDETSPLPRWKQDFLSKPSVSVRRGIAWGYGAPSEDTDTLVLTAPSGQFVDIRFPKDAKSTQEVRTHPSYWAFSGNAETTFYDAGPYSHTVDLPYTAHCKFSHNIDTRGAKSREAGDEGDMFLLQNGECLEMGIMLNPVSQQKELYKEYWVAALSLSSEDGKDDSRSCIVARAAGIQGGEGLVIRIGGRIQGIMSRPSEDGSELIDAERWIRNSASSGLNAEEISQGDATTQWTRDVRSSGSFPIAWLSTTALREGATIEFEGITWVISEAHN